MSVKKETEAQPMQMDTTSSQDKEKVEVLQLLAEINTDRYWYRICEKSWSKGSFFSLERGDLVRIMGSSDKGQGYPTKMFTLPQDKQVLEALVQGIQKIPHRERKQR